MIHIDVELITSSGGTPVGDEVREVWLYPDGRYMIITRQSVDDCGLPTIMPSFEDPIFGEDRDD